MTFQASTYDNFVAARSVAQERLIAQYSTGGNEFDIVVVGSGVGGGVLADDLAERLGGRLRILVLEAGSYLYPTHVYNLCRFSNSDVAGQYGCRTFWQGGQTDRDERFIGGLPQLNFGGRSIFWSGLIPSVQGWELDFFPPRVRHDLAAGLLNRAGETMNESRSMGSVAQAVVSRLRNSPLAADFSIQETPRALHQPYLQADGTPKDEYFTEPTGVFNTAELLTNQLGFKGGDGHGPGLRLLLNRYVEDVQDHGDRLEVIARNTLTGEGQVFRAGRVVLAAGSIESPKLLRRSSMFPGLPDGVKGLVGRGLTDHPTTDWITTWADGIGNVGLDRDDHAKIIFYSRGVRDGGRIRYPFNVEMNLNHEYWHLRRVDPADGDPPPVGGKARVDIKFSFGDCLDDGNEVRPAPPYGYVPEVVVYNNRWADRLAGSRFPALVGWQGDAGDLWPVLNHVTHQIFSQFHADGHPARPEGPDDGNWFGENERGFGYGTVHHAVGTLRMPARPRYDQPFAGASVVDEDLRVVGTERLYACDMSVMPMSTAANPVRTLVALALRLSGHLG